MKSKYENLKIIYKRNKFGWYWSPLYFAFWFLLFYLTVIPSFYYFPDTLTLKDEPSHPDRFIGERAEKNLLRLTKIGPKVVGSAANEQATVKFLLKEIDKIKKNARNDLYEIEFDVQIASGNYVLWKMVNMYHSIQNVVVKLIPRFTNSTASLLINTHFDSVPGSSGAGDAGVMVVVMLEVLRVIVKNETTLTHSIVFLFNGAEENPLQGSHAFITQHKWARDVKAVMNLDSAGSGGREILFQSGPDHPWMMNYYGSSIWHPYASTIGEELFQNDFIPSETDFRIFRDFGHIPGFDMAHTQNGFVYHTKYDRFNLIPRRTYQLTGDNVLSLTKALANAPELENPEKYAEGHTIFFDVLGWFMIYYSETTGLIVNITVTVVALITILTYIWIMAHQTGMFRRRIFARFAVIFVIQLLSVVVAVATTIGIGLFLDNVGLPLSWFAHHWLIFGLYFCPMFFIVGIGPAIYLHHTKEHGLPLGYAVQLIMHAHCLILTIVSIFMISFGIRSAFVVMISIGFYSLSVLLNMATCFHKKTFLWLIPHIICQIFPYIFYTYICYAFYVTFIPMQGRDGAESNPELLISGFTAIMCVLFAGFTIPLLNLFRKSKTIISLFAVAYFVFVILATTSVGFPYVENEAPQRYFAVHTTRTFHSYDGSTRKNDSGYFVVSVDRRPESLRETLLSTNLTSPTVGDCETEVMCGYPIYSARWLGYIKQSYWMPGPSPKNIQIPKLKIVEKKLLSPTNIMFLLEISGPDHMSFFFQPLENVKLVDWSFNKEPIKKNFTPPYFVYYSNALDSTPLTFSLEFERNSFNRIDGTFDIAVIGHLVHHEMYFTKDFKHFLETFPPWAHVSAWMSSYESWSL